MGFLDDLGKGLNKVGKKTSEMAGIAKVKLEITKQKVNLDKKYQDLGERYYFLNKEGMPLDDEIINGYIDEIDQLLVTISNLESEVAEPGVKCEKCGATVSEGDKFCGTCGHSMVKEEEKRCPNCNAVIGDAKFCNSCGTSIE